MYWRTLIQMFRCWIVGLLDCSIVLASHDPDLLF